MRLDIHHRTEYAYPVPARRVMQALRLWPSACAHQRVLDWQVRVAGQIVLPRAADAFGNAVTVHAAEGPIAGLVVEVSGCIEVSEESGIVRGARETLPDAFYRGPTPLTASDAAIVQLARAAWDEDSLSCLHGLMGSVRDRIDFSVRHTDAETPAAQALQLGAGVCQDHAQVMISAARILGFPARYVSGYMLTGSGQIEPASHAWCEVLVPGLGWVGFDPANRCCPTEGYVRVAIGRDARDASPIRGCREGGGSEEAMAVAVQVSLSAIQQQ